MNKEELKEVDFTQFPPVAGTTIYYVSVIAEKDFTM